MREVFGLTYRQTEGFGRSLVRLMGVDLKIPDYTSLQKRAAKLEVALNVMPTEGGRDIVIDSTGLKVYGDGEWKARKHGVSKRRTWRKFHIAIDPKTGEIVAEQLTGNDIHDADPVEAMIGQIEEPIERFFGDGAYDQRKVYDALEFETAEPLFPLARTLSSGGTAIRASQSCRVTKRSEKFAVQAEKHGRTKQSTILSLIHI